MFIYSRPADAFPLRSPQLSDAKRHTDVLQYRSMKPIQWNAEKNFKLIQERGISFEDILFSLQGDGLLDDLVHPNREDYPHQRMFVVALNAYVYLVPYVESEEAIFLKTIIPSRKATKRYFGDTA